MRQLRDASAAPAETRLKPLIMCQTERADAAEFWAFSKLATRRLLAEEED